MNTSLRILAAIMAMTAGCVQALPLDEHPQARQFIEQMVRHHGFEASYLTDALSDAEIKRNILKAIQRPAEAKPWHQYRKIFLTERRIGEGVDFWRRHQAILDKVHEEYGVPPEIIVAILGVETLYGSRTGSFRVLDALSTLAFAYPKRAPFFRKELEQFFLLSREEALDPRHPRGSYAGAMGWPQFMPSSYRHYAADFDGDGKRDIWSNPGDVIASVANYFSRHGWQRGKPVATRLQDSATAFADGTLKPSHTLHEWKRKGLTLAEKQDESLKASVFALEGKDAREAWLGYENFYVITRYNHSPLYAMAVYQLSREIKRRMGKPAEK